MGMQTEPNNVIDVAEYVAMNQGKRKDPFAVQL